MAYDANVLSATTTQTAGSLLAIGAVWTFSVTVPSTLATSCAVVTPQNASLLSAAPVVSVSANTITVKITLAIAVASGSSQVFNIRVFI